MKHVAYYNRNHYAVGSYIDLNPAQIIGAVDVPEGRNIYEVASETWLKNNCVVAKPTGYDTESEAITAGRTAANEYWQRKGKA